MSHHIKQPCNSIEKQGTHSEGFYRT